MNKIVFKPDTKTFSLKTHPNKLNIESISAGKHILIPTYHTESGLGGWLKSWLKNVWGAIMTYFGSGGGDTSALSIPINRVLAMRLVNKAIKGNWNLKKLCQECLKEVKTAQNVGTVTMTVESGFLAFVLGTAANVPLWVPIVVFGFCMSLGLTLGRFLTKKGFIRFVSSFIDNKFMPEINKMALNMKKERMRARYEKELKKLKS